ncbi:hypothetical protein SBFV2_gp22 [Sulfolobales Beppu filamentous virus 2]|uniref:Uncharacterized protein n=1 Tax=Sulfolobales Beppu filamentous virus 2 TaxID=2493123 RepID=A0A3S8NER0_9VIRU|nr:hypothetical protein HOU84_gp22 [Sulfolobales Beppu filamentous virus 2]AZI75789.1 hypothetical protein SBFV2_gp22 [Sulfolobales Beppu filamentous virus 2]
MTCNGAIIKIKKYMKHPRKFFQNSPKTSFIDITGTGYTEFYYKYNMAQVDMIYTNDNMCVKRRLEELGFIKVRNMLAKVVTQNMVVMVEEIGKGLQINIAYRGRVYKMKMQAYKYTTEPKVDFLAKLKKAIEMNSFNELLIAQKIQKIKLRNQPEKKVNIIIDVPYYNVIYNVSKITDIKQEIVPLYITRLI